jgi:fucose 4-O-acetylase-like acetyltransferase
VKAGVDPWFWVGTLFWVVSCLGVWFLDLVLLCPSLLLLKLSRESLPSLSLLLLGLHPLTGLGPQLLL